MARWFAAQVEQRGGLIEDLRARSPELAAELEARVQALAFLGIALDGPERSPLSFPERLGNFHLLRRLGGGGMGVVYLAHDEDLGRDVALKLVRPGELYFPGMRERFQREVELAARLEHANIVPIFSVGLEGDLPYFAMERVVGCTLAEALRELTLEGAAQADGRSLCRAVARATSTKFGQPVEPQQAPLWEGSLVSVAVRIAAAVARALQHAHQRGVLHRDVKSSNVLLTPGGRVLLFDFGLAHSSESSSLTRTGSQLGSLPYMPPEQLRGETLDARSDVYSLGVTFYELLSLRWPFEGASGEALRASILAGSPRPPRPTLLGRGAVLRDAEVVCLTAMDRDAARRYASAEAFAQDLERVLERRPIRARAAGPTLRATRLIQRHPTAGIALGLGLLAFVVAPLIGYWKVRAERDRVATALAEVERLSNAELLRTLQTSRRELYPAVPARIAAMDGWLGSAGALLESLPEHRRLLAALEAQAPREQQTGSASDAASGVDSGVEPEPGTLQAAGPAADVDAWKRRLLTELIEGIETLPAAMDEVRARRDFASRVRHLTLDSDAAREGWALCVDDLAQRPRYAGLTLEPQLGLLPLDIDPESELWEFWLPETGVLPERDLETGRFSIDGESAIVLVLIPGGEVAYAGGGSLQLEPFFLSKHEMTQGQWLRATGRNPALVAPGYAAARVDLSHPVERVTWFESERTLAWLGLCLPTEIEWAHAARAGTLTPYSFGADPRDMARHGNVATTDMAAIGIEDTEAWSDGHAVHAPVGSYLPNPFGLHDVHGNVSEWVRERLELVSEDDAAERLPGFDAASAIQRGGSFDMPAFMAETRSRTGDTPDSASPLCGLRPARRVQ